ncbi:MAG: helix-turn-helix domain-containing protein, partial [Acidobacteriota bacterium]|nr:helix-turn-helix domain-containing protein [Acidobacteriota bacterium]
ACHSAILSRDSRFDGVFFTAVKTTRIYCRPVCPARTPKPENCDFFPTAAEAEHAGFRPCLRCRPELAPHSQRSLADRAASRVLAQIRSGDLADGRLTHLASEMGMSERHLRRQFVSEFGLPPIAYAQTQRLLFAKQLLQETALPTTDVAFSAGFQSLRRFHALFQKRYGLAPGEIRRSGKLLRDADTITLRLAYRPPLAWDELLAFLAPRTIEGVERIENGAYRRTISIGGKLGWVSVRRQPDEHTLIATVPSHLASMLRPILSRLRGLFDLDADPAAISAHFVADSVLGEFVVRTPGLRVPGAWDGFELAVRAILGQQVSVKGASTLAGRLAARFGSPVETPYPALSLIGADASKLASASVEEIAGIGLPKNRAASLQSLAKAVCAGRLTLSIHADAQAEVAALKTVPGIGDWTAQYVALRALRWPDAFPAGDLGLRKAAGDGSPVSASALRERSEPWRPWRAYAAMYLWHSLGGEKTNA